MKIMTMNFGNTQKETLVRKTLESRSLDFLRFLQSIVHSPVDAEDLFQSGSIRTIEKSEEIEDLAKTYPWMLSVFRNLALDFLRKRERLNSNISSLESEMLENLPAVHEQSEASVCDCGTKLLEDLPERYSSLLKNIEMNGNSVKETAKELGISPGNVSVRLHRARASLKLAVKDHCQVETLNECLECDCKDA